MNLIYTQAEMDEKDARIRELEAALKDIHNLPSASETVRRLAYNAVKSQSETFAESHKTDLNDHKVHSAEKGVKP